MVPPEAFSTEAPQSSSAFCSGCEAGTQCEIFRSKFLSCANAGVTLAASSNAKNAFLISSLLVYFFGLGRPLHTLLYDIMIIASLRQNAGPRVVQAYNIGRSMCCGQK